MFYLHDYVSVYRKTATSVSHSTRGTSMAATLSAYAFVKSLRLPAPLEPSRRQALRRLVPIVVSIHARNGEARAGWRIARAHLFAYNYGFSARLYYHLLMLARAAWRGRLPMPRAAADAVAGVAATPSMATVAAVGAATVNEAARVDEFVDDGTGRELARPAACVGETDRRQLSEARCSSLAD